MEAEFSLWAIGPVLLHIDSLAAAFAQALSLLEEGSSFLKLVAAEAVT